MGEELRGVPVLPRACSMVEQRSLRTGSRTQTLTASRPRTRQEGAAGRMDQGGAFPHFSQPQLKGHLWLWGLQPSPHSSQGPGALPTPLPLPNRPIYHLPALSPAQGLCASGSGVCCSLRLKCYSRRPTSPLPVLNAPAQRGRPASLTDPTPSCQLPPLPRGTVSTTATITLPQRNN